MRTDRSIADQKLAGDTVRRVLGFARPHRALIAVFLGLTVVDAALVVVQPLLVARIVDDGILKNDGALVTLLALAMAGVAIVDAALGLSMGYLSSRIGEGLI
jgi:ATP-binding cassette subfamily B protein